MRLVLDTNVLVAALRSRTGASNPLVVAGLRRQFDWCCSVPLFYEYEDVLNRAELLLDAGMTRAVAKRFLDTVALNVIEIEVHFRWRPQLSDPGDEMVLEAAINAKAAVVTHNTRDFGPAPARFGLDLLTPAEALRRMMT